VAGAVLFEEGRTVALEEGEYLKVRVEAVKEQSSLWEAATT
jgi:hypothetical protein